MLFAVLDVEAQHEESRPPLHTYNVSAEGLWLAGNTSRLIIGGRGHWTIQPNPTYRLVLRPSYFFGRVNGRITDREVRIEGLGYVEKFPGESWYGFALGIYTHSRLRKVDTRYQGGLGLGLHLLQEEDKRLSMSLALLAEKTTFATGEVRQPFRGSFRLEGHLIYGDNDLRLGLESLVKPKLFDTADLIWLTLLTIDAPLNEQLAARLALESVYETIVPDSLDSHDVRLTFGLTFGL